MPLNRSAYRRYRIIDEMIRTANGGCPTKKQIKEKCEMDLYGENMGRISNSTIEKDIHFMRNDPDILAPIVYDKSNKGYRYTKPNYTFNKKPLLEKDAEALSLALAVLNGYLNTGLHSDLSESIDNIALQIDLEGSAHPANIAKLIRFETTQFNTGAVHLKSMIKAIRNQLEVEVTYNSYSSDSTGTVTLQPLLLKQYLSRWYVLCQANQGHFLTYSLDRIVGPVKITRNRFEKSSSDEVSTSWYNNSIGVTVTNGKPVRVVLSFDPFQGKYIKSLPMHSSQKVIDDNKSEVRIELLVLINWELISEILRHQNTVKVISPLRLAKKMRTILSKMRSAYK